MYSVNFVLVDALLAEIFRFNQTFHTAQIEVNTG